MTRHSRREEPIHIGREIIVTALYDSDDQYEEYQPNSELTLSPVLHSLHEQERILRQQCNSDNLLSPHRLRRNGKSIFKGIRSRLRRLSGSQHNSSNDNLPPSPNTEENIKSKSYLPREKKKEKKKEKMRKRLVRDDILGHVDSALHESTHHSATEKSEREEEQLSTENWTSSHHRRMSMTGSVFTAASSAAVITAASSHRVPGATSMYTQPSPSLHTIDSPRLKRKDFESAPQPSRIHTNPSQSRIHTNPSQLVSSNALPQNLPLWDFEEEEQDIIDLAMSPSYIRSSSDHLKNHDYGNTTSSSHLSRVLASMNNNNYNNDNSNTNYNTNNNNSRVQKDKRVFSTKNKSFSDYESTALRTPSSRKIPRQSLLFSN